MTFYILISYDIVCYIFDTQHYYIVNFQKNVSIYIIKQPTKIALTKQFYCLCVQWRVTVSINLLRSCIEI